MNQKLLSSLIFLGLLSLSLACAKAPHQNLSSLKQTDHSLSPLKVIKTEQGLASWYGKPFHGRLTANGETYNMYSYTAAHKELPLGSWVRITNLENGRKLFVRINDRGPYVHKRIVDLSYAAARDLGVLKHGVAQIKVEVFDKQQNDLFQNHVNQENTLKEKLALR